MQLLLYFTNIPRVTYVGLLCTSRVKRIQLFFNPHKRSCKQLDAICILCKLSSKYLKNQSSKFLLKKKMLYDFIT